MDMNNSTYEIHLKYLESKLSFWQDKFKIYIEFDNGLEANISLRMINHYQYQISQHKQYQFLERQENIIIDMLKEVLSAIENGESIDIVDGVTTAYTQTFGKSFVDRIKKALNK